MSFERTHSDALRAFLSALDHHDTLLALVADGWPLHMVKRGLALHQKTWDFGAICDAAHQELATLSQPHTPVRSILHIWPSGPGSGLAPMLFGWLLGIPQDVRPSSHTMHFARHIQRLWNTVAPTMLPLRLVTGAPTAAWSRYERVILSGSDQVLATVASDLAGPQMPALTGYGHRTSFALLDDANPHDDLQGLLDALALDIVLWHQSGCFSPLALMYLGERADHVAQLLANSIGAMETELDAFDISDAALATRAQSLGMAEFLGDFIAQAPPPHIGWVQRTDSPWRGQHPGPHAITLHTLDTPDDIQAHIDVPPSALQAAALACRPQAHEGWTKRLMTLGVTRICPFGALQSPPASWWHDGRPNLLGVMVRVCNVER